MTKEWSEGFSKRVETAIGIDTVTTECWTPEQVEEVRRYLGHEPNADDLRSYFSEV